MVSDNLLLMLVSVRVLEHNGIVQLKRQRTCPYHSELDGTCSRA